MAPVLSQNKEFILIYNRQVDMVYRVCYSFIPFGDGGLISTTGQSE